MIGDVTNEADKVARIQRLVQSIKRADAALGDIAYEVEDAVEAMEDLSAMLKKESR